MNLNSNLFIEVSFPSTIYTSYIIFNLYLVFLGVFLPRAFVYSLHSIQILHNHHNRIIQLKSSDRERSANVELRMMIKNGQLACLNAILLHGFTLIYHIGGITEHINCVQNINGNTETTQGNRRCVCHQNTQLLCSVTIQMNSTKRSSRKLMYGIGISFETCL